MDTATVMAPGLPEPILAEVTLVVSPPDRRAVSLDSAGGQAVGADGRVEVRVPPGALAGGRAIVIRDLKDPSAKGRGDPWVPFAVEMHEVTRSGQPAGPGPNNKERDQRIHLGPVVADFNRPVELSVSFGGLADLSTLGGEYAPFLVTLDEASGTWVRVPLSRVDRKANTITAEVRHFSTWGAGIGPSIPQNGASVLLFDSARPDLFTGRARYSIPLWTPPGRNGLAPDLALTYSSGTADGVLGDVQAPWTGMGWTVDTAEIARKVTSGLCGPCGNGAFGYENKFVLLLGGTGYELVADGSTPGRYHTKAESFLYVQLHNAALGNTPSPANATGEWWEVVERDGTRWRLGWTADAEQRAAMRGYPGAASGAWAGLGYAGGATDVVAGRWRADRVTDPHGNTIAFAYAEETRAVAGASASYDRASYPATVAYTGHTSGTPAPGYSVAFVRESRGGAEVPAPLYDWDNWDTERLDRIEVRHGAAVVRTYDLGYELRAYSDDGKTWDTTTLTSVAVLGGDLSASDRLPTVTFAYADKDNRAGCGAGCQEWAYPRLATIANGWGATATYTYGDDGRTASSAWYDWRVEGLAIADGVSADPMRTAYTYSGPCYEDDSQGWCNAGDAGELVGYAQTTAMSKDFDGTTLAIEVHKFHTDEQRAGREYQTQRHAGAAGGTVLAQTDTTYTVVTAGLPPGGFHTYPSRRDEHLRWGAGLARITRTDYEYDSTTGNLTREQHYHGGTLGLYRSIEYAYATNPSPAVWILDRVARTALADAGGATLSEQRFGYDGNAPGSGTLTQGDLTLAQAVNGTQTTDTAYGYDAYGNRTQTRTYTAYGTPGALPAGGYRATTVAFDATLVTYPTSITNPLDQSTSTGYDFALGLPTTATDPNGQTTATGYDGLGRVTSIKYPGYVYGQADVTYTYPAPPVSAPFALRLQAYDQPAGDYRSAWTLYDGLGRALQVQAPDETGTGLIVADTAYDARGRVQYSGRPRAVGGSGGAFVPRDWFSLPHTTTGYDALGRVISVQYPDGSSQTVSYDGLRTTAVDPNGHRRVEESDRFGRLATVEEYTGTGASQDPYAPYATTAYAHDARDLLTGVTDALGNVTAVAYDGWGRKTGMDDPDMGAWGYAYNALGDLTGQTDARGCTTTLTYDALSRLTGKAYAGPGGCATTPAVDYTYDAGTNGIGRRTGMSDASGTTAWAYDALGRATSETRTIGGTAHTLAATYDAFGRLLSRTYPDNETLYYAYNAMGALEAVSSSLGATYASSLAYNADGRVTNLARGNGVTTNYAYDPLTSRLTSAVSAKVPQTPLLDLAYMYDTGGNLTRIVDGTRAETTDYGYDALDRLTSAVATSGLTTVYQQAFGYDPTGNLLSVGRWPSGPDARRVSGSLGGAALAVGGSRNRLTAFVGAAYASASHSGGSVAAFTAGGLRPAPSAPLLSGRASVASGALAANVSRHSVTAFTGGSAGLAFTRGASGYSPTPPPPEPGWSYANYTYGPSAGSGPAGPHAVTALSTGETYQYDANGNMTTRVEGGLTYAQTFDAENRLISVTATGQTTQFIYDGDGNLVKKIRPDGTATVYVGTIYEVELSAGGTQMGTTSYYALPGARVQRSGASLSYVLTDHLGSASVTLDASGAVQGEQRYYPFGATRAATGAMGTDRLYTGQRDVGLGGLIHFNARFYSAALGRFLSADSLVPNPSDPQGLNRYSYVLNSPLNYNDPTGHMCADPDAPRKRCDSSPLTRTRVGSVVVQGSGLGAGKPRGGGGGGVPGATVTPAPSLPPTPTVTPTTSTPTVTATACPQVALACVPTATSTPSPTTTPTPYAGPAITAPDPPTPHLVVNVHVDWSQVDYIDAGIDVLGLIGNGVEIGATIAGHPEVALTANVAGGIVEGAGLIKSGVELLRGDPKNMLVQQTTSTGEKLAVMFWRGERMAPYVGAIGNLFSLGINLKPRITVEWVTP